MVFVALVGLLLQAPADPEVEPGVFREPEVGGWIWTDETADRQECRLVRAFEIPDGAKVDSALMRVTADNYYEIFLDGQLIGRGGDWRVLTEYNVKSLLDPGRHGLAVRVLNDFDYAGLVFGFRIVLGDGRVIEIVSDESWKIAPSEGDAWKKPSREWEKWPEATIVRPFRPVHPPLVYQAMPSEPVVLSIWERRWFQVTVLVIVGASLAAGVVLGSRLFLQSQMETLVRRERSRIAIDLHDDLGGGLTQLVLLGESSRRDLPEDSSTGQALARLCDQSRGLVRRMNETVWLINSERDNLRDFASYVVKYAESFFQTSPVRSRFDIEGDLPPLPFDLGIRRNLFLAVKEACNNIVRHSGASRATISVHRQRQELVISVRDNGRGFDPQAKVTGNGLRNMRQRVTEVGGRFKLSQRPEGGTLVEFRIPLQAQARLRLARILPWRKRGTSAE